MLALFHWRPPAGLWFLVGGLALFAVADVVYLFHAANGTYQPGGLNDAVWVLATLLMAFAPGWAKRPAGVSLPSWVLLGIPIGATLCRRRPARLRPTRSRCTRWPSRWPPAPSSPRWAG